MTPTPKFMRSGAALAASLVLVLSACDKPQRLPAPVPSRTAPAGPAAPAPAAPSPAATNTATAATNGATAAKNGAPAAAPAAAPNRVPAFAELPQGTVISDQWYEVLDDGRKTSWYHMVWTRSEFEGRPTIHDHTETASAETRDMAGMEDVFESESVTDLERTEEGMLLHLKFESTQAGRTASSEVRREGASYVSVERVANREERREIATAELVPVDAEAFLAPKVRAGELKPGMKLTFPWLNWEGRRVETAELTVEGEEDLATAVGKARCWRVLEVAAGGRVKKTWWIDERGAVARLRQGTTTFLRTTEDEARDLDPSAAKYSITIPANPELPRSTSLDRCVVDVTIDLHGGSEMPDFPATPFSKEMSRTGNIARVELTSYEDRKATVALPVTDPALARWLEDTNLYAPTHPKVRKAVAAALKDVPEASRSDGRTVAAALLRYVFKTLKKASGPIPQPTAPEILDDCGGDCSEHAVLFVALCRSAGLPARRLTGYAQVGDMWGAHSFCEIWLGKWHGADPTTNELGTRARYLCFGWEEDPDSYPDLVSQRVRGRMSIRTVEFTDAGQTLTIAEAQKRKPLRDDLAGIVFAKPGAGWTASVGGHVGTATITGPGVRAELQVLAGMGDLDAGLLRQGPFSGREATFGGRPAVRVGGGLMRGNAVTWAIPWRRRTLILSVQASRSDEPAAIEGLAKILEPMLAEPPAATPAPAKPDGGSEK